MNVLGSAFKFGKDCEVVTCIRSVWVRDLEQY
jgi:hypothetical protein